MLSTKSASRLLALVLFCALVTAPTAYASKGEVNPSKHEAAAASKHPKAKKKPWMPKAGAHFNVPRTGAKRFRIEEQIVGAIKHAHKGSYINITAFSFDRTPVAQALVNAHRRGVHVQILLNDHQVTHAQRMLHRALGKNRFRSSFSYECTHGCRAPSENLHTKMYLFSRTGGATDVVMTGSANLTFNADGNQYNDTWIANDAPKIYRGFKALFASMRQDVHVKRSKQYWVQNLTPTIQLQALPFPGYSPHHDPIMTILNRVRCTGATGTSGNGNHRTVVRVSMHAWNDTRGVYLAKKVRRLYAAGCDVRLMYGMAGRDVRDVFAGRTKRGYLPLHIDGYDTNGDGFIDLYSHQKELLISGHYGSRTNARVVVTGSSNWNNHGAIGDEEIFVMRRPFAYKQYMRNFRFIWEERSHGARYVPGNGRTFASLRMAMENVPKAGGPAWEAD